VASTEITLTTGERLMVDGDPESVEAVVVSASRGAMLALAWLTELDGGKVGIHPDHVVRIRGAQA
jgi:hypothetical protein